MAERLRRHRRTKIIATLGPASSTPEMMGQLFQAGADIFRLNFSHGSHADHAARIEIIRALGSSSRAACSCRPGRISSST
jgi:pyruvate kinase